MKKIFLILAVLVSLNAFSTPKMTDYIWCEFKSSYDLERCVNEKFRRGYEIIGVSNSVVGNRFKTFIHMAIIEK